MTILSLLFPGAFTERQTSLLLLSCSCSATFLNHKQKKTKGSTVKESLSTAAACCLLLLLYSFVRSPFIPGITERLMELRFHILIVAVVAVAFFSLLRLGPSLSTVVSFFWPLLLSTAFFLTAVAVLLRISPPPADTAAGRAGEELMDYVAGQPQDDAMVAEAEETVRGVDQEPEADHRKSE